MFVIDAIALLESKGNYIGMCIDDVVCKSFDQDLGANKRAAT
jgi:hypothetical protein